MRCRYRPNASTWAAAAGANANSREQTLVFCSLDGEVNERECPPLPRKEPDRLSVAMELSAKDRLSSKFGDVM